MTNEVAKAGPVADVDRIDELDMLRGFALIGVLLVNFVGFAGAGLMATEDQLAALPTAKADAASLFVVEWLFAGKANTMFATLFGLGFYLQLTRNAGKPGFIPRYSRRLFWLFVFGMLNVVFLWVWDILNLYALTGFLLLAARKWPTRLLVSVGAAAAIFDRRWLHFITEKLDITLMNWDPYSDASVLARQEALGDYGQLVQLMWQYTWLEWFAGGAIAASIVYAFGRFLLGAAIGRSGILTNIKGHLPLLRRIAIYALGGGLILSLMLRLLADGEWVPFGDASRRVGSLLTSTVSLIHAAGYSAALVVAYHTVTGKRILSVFQPMGKMALTNYLMQGFVYGFVLTSVGPGLGLAGKIGSLHVVAISAVFFIFQMTFSAYWLSGFRFGPMEWLWRWLTYGGAMPRMRREVAA